MGHAGSVRGDERVHATVITEGRECQARALPGSAVGSATGPVVLADCASTLHASAGWMPGRILVLTEHAATLEVLDELLDAPNALGFVGIVVLADERSTSLAQEGDPPSRSIAAIPVVLVSRAQDRECVRHAVRLSLQVQDTAIEAPIPAPRHHLRRRGAPPGRSRDGSHRVPGTIDLRRK